MRKQNCWKETSINVDRNDNDTIHIAVHIWKLALLKFWLTVFCCIWLLKSLKDFAWKRFHHLRAMPWLHTSVKLDVYFTPHCNQIEDDWECNTLTLHCIYVAKESTANFGFCWKCHHKQSLRRLSIADDWMCEELQCNQLTQ